MNKKNHLHHIKASNVESCILLSAGCGMRRRYAYPEPLFPIGEKVLIDYQIASIKKYNKNCQIILVIGFKSKKVIDHIHENYKDIILVENPNYESTTAVESLRMAMNVVTRGDLFFVYGNNFFNNYIFTFKDKKRPVLVKQNEQTKKSYNLGIIEQNGVLTNISYGADQEWAEVMFIPQCLFYNFREAIKEIKPHEDMSHLINLFNSENPIDISSHKKGKSINIFKVNKE